MSKNYINKNLQFYSQILFFHFISCPERMGCPGNGLCLACEFPSECQIGSNVTVNCSSPRCGQQSIQRQAECLFCWQLADSQLECEVLRNCSTNDVALHRTICKVRRNVICAGRRTFYKNRKSVLKLILNYHLNLTTN